MTTADTDPASPPAAPEHLFRKSLGWTALSAVAPGSGLIKSGRRIVGGVLLAVFALAVVGLIGYAAWGIQDIGRLAGHATNAPALRVLTFVLILVTLGWVASLVASHLFLRPGKLSNTQRLVGSIFVAGLSLVIATPLAVAARYSWDQANLLDAIFGSENDTKSATRTQLDPNDEDPWDGKDRVNLLLLGADSTDTRVGVRTDTVMVASIDTRTGNTSLFALPRNTQHMPFPEDSPLSQIYPDGFVDPDGIDGESYLYAMYENVAQNPEVPPNILGETDYFGADVLKLSTGEALGLTIDYFVMINIEGFTALVEALGGITVNVNERVPMGGNTDRGIKPFAYIEPGPDKHLNGREALWFARGRYGSSDYQRMDRQRCVIAAMIKQVNPANLITKYEAVASASQNIISTDIPRQVLPQFVDLGLKVQQANVRSLTFNRDNGFISEDPDFDLVRRQVDETIGRAQQPSPEPSPAPAPPQTSEPPPSEPEPSPSPSPTDDAPPSPEASTPGTPQPPAPPPDTDIQDACAYNPAQATATPTP